jgi:Protein of unknown function (DUF2934)
MLDATPKFRKSKRRSTRVQTSQFAPEQADYGNIEEMVRLRAYHLWEREGKPSGREAEHWTRAQGEIRCELRERKLG